MLPAAFAGHSLGGAVALRAAALHPSDVTAVVLLAGAGISSARPTFEGKVTVALLGRPSRAVAPFRTVIARTPWTRWLVFGHWQVADPPALSADATDGFLAGPGLHTDVGRAARALRADDMRFGLDRVRCPCLCVWGADDRMVPLADGFDYARRLRAPLRVIADCGHLLIGERPAACADAIVTFLRARETRSLPFSRMSASPRIAVVGDYAESEETHRATNARAEGGRRRLRLGTDRRASAIPPARWATSTACGSRREAPTTAWTARLPRSATPASGECRSWARAAASSTSSSRWRETCSGSRTRTTRRRIPAPSISP